MTFMTGLQCHLVRDEISRRSAVGLRSVSRTARGRLRLRRRPRRHDAATSIESARAERLALPGAAADHRRAAHRFHSGYTPLVRADRLAKQARAAASCTSRTIRSIIRRCRTRIASCRWPPRAPSNSDSRSFGCASTGNLANSVSAHAARLGLECYVFIPHDLELGKVLGSAVFRPHVIGVRGNYDDVNRLCTQIADKHGWGFANINLRSYYAEGAKTLGFEVAEQLGWRFPQHLVSPVAGGTLLPRIFRGFRELREIGLVDGELPRIHAAQAAGCAPVVRALAGGSGIPGSGQADDDRLIDRDRESGRWLSGGRNGQLDRRLRRRVDRRRDPAGDGAARRDRRHLHRTGGRRDARRRDPARAAAASIPANESVVVCITGNGYKTAAETIASRVAGAIEIGRSLAGLRGVSAVGAGKGGGAAECISSPSGCLHLARRSGNDLPPASARGTPRFRPEGHYMAHRILIPTPLRPFAGKQDVVEVEGGTVGEIAPGACRALRRSPQAPLHRRRQAPELRQHLRERRRHPPSRAGKDRAQGRRHRQHRPVGRRRRRRRRAARSARS